MKSVRRGGGGGGSCIACTYVILHFLHFCWGQNYKNCDFNVDWHDVNVLLVSLLKAKNVRLQFGRGGGRSKVPTKKV